MVKQYEYFSIKMFKKFVNVAIVLEPTMDCFSFLLRFLDASRSPTGSPLAVVCGSVSGTVAFLEVTDESTGSVAHTIVPSYLLVAMMMICTTRVRR